jgi:hypothetical protein
MSSQRDKYSEFALLSKHILLIKSFPLIPLNSQRFSVILWHGSCLDKFNIQTRRNWLVGVSSRLGNLRYLMVPGWVLK